MRPFEWSPEKVKESSIYKEWGLTQEEYETIEASLQRLPTATETGIFSGMWSEHCSYKSSKHILKNFYSSADHVLQGPGEGAGIIDIGDQQGIVFKMESHNSPSAVEPYEGAATGVGGAVRDIFSMGATPIALLDSLRFGNPTTDRVRYSVDQVIQGIADYGNGLGVPTVGGEIAFDDCYRHNPLVNAMCVGIVSHDGIVKGIASGIGNLILYAGSTTGRDGIHGASFSSKEFGEGNKGQGSAVQAGDAYKERRLMDAFEELFANHLDDVIGVQDMGAAGLVSSSSEMAEKAGMGVELYTHLVPTREPNMSAYELLLSESQERMLLCIQAGSEQRYIDLFTKHGLTAVVIGKVTDDGQYRVIHNEECVVDVPVSLLTDGVPSRINKSVRPERIGEETEAFVEIDNLADFTEQLVTSPDMADRSSLYKQFDSRAKNNTVVVPGSDSGVIRIPETKKAIALTTDGNSRYVYLDPYVGAQIAVCEAARNIVATGGKPLGITDCLNFGPVTIPEIAYEFEYACKGINDACKALGTPVISGNVSMSNASPDGPIYPTPIIGMLGLLHDVKKLLPNQLQQAEDLLYVIGETKDDYAGSVAQKIQSNRCFGSLSFDLRSEVRNQQFVYDANQESLLQSAHDLSEGGLMMALLESVFGTSLGLEVSVPFSDAALLSETQSRFLVSIKSDEKQRFEAFIASANMQEVVVSIGTVTNHSEAKIETTQGQTTLNLDDLYTKWRTALPQALKRRYE